MIISTIAFYVFSSLVVLSSLGVVASKNPVHSVLFLIFAFFNAGGLFVLLGAEFIAMLLVIVYVGAVAVLFLFVVMMLNINYAELKAGFMKRLPLGLTVAVLLLAELIFIIQISYYSSWFDVFGPAHPVPQELTNVKALGMLLYTHYAFVFELAGFVLLIAMIGAIVLTHRVRENVKKQNITKQVWRDRHDSVQLVKIQSRKGV